MGMVFVTKSADCYKDRAVGVFPVKGGDIADVKFCYPCDVREVCVDFNKGTINPISSVASDCMGREVVLPIKSKL